jgi:serine/threonine protein kinase
VSRTCPACGTAYSDDAFFCGADGTITVQDQPENPADFDPRLGQRLGGYIVVARVADGAMGRVYEGRHPETRERVAVKVLHDAVSRDRVAVERFRREYEAAKEMKSPYIVTVLEFGETSDQSYFMTMEYLNGAELAKAVATRVQLALPRIVRITCQLALALEHAHSFGFIHRDLKPDNIFLCDTPPEGVTVRVLDFGSVKLQVEMGPKLTALGTTLGSPYYMSPEQATGALDVDQRSDVFAFGAILWEMLTGKTAFEAQGVARILMKILNESPPPPSSLRPSVTPALDAVVDRALRKDKQQRYASALELARGVLNACGLLGTPEQWSTAAESEIERALAVGPPPKVVTVSSKPPVVSTKPPAPPPPVGHESLRVSHPVLPRVSQPTAAERVSFEQLTIPGHAPKAKWIVSVAIGVAVLCLLALLLR